MQGEQLCVTQTVPLLRNKQGVVTPKDCQGEIVTLTRFVGGESGTDLTAGLDLSAGGQTAARDEVQRG